MTDHNYERLKTRVEEIEPSLQWPTNVAFALFAFGAAVILGLIPWSATFPTLPDAVRADWGWVSGAGFATIFFSASGIGLCLFAQWRNRGRRSRDKASVLEDMRDTEAASRAAMAAGTTPDA